MPGETFEMDSAATAGRRTQMETGFQPYLNGEALPTTFSMRVANDYRPQAALCRIELADPQPIALNLRLGTPGDVFDFDVMAQYPQLANPAGGDEGGGVVLIVEYGDLMGRHRLVADCRSGSYLLPAVTFAQAFSLRWDRGGVAQYALQVAASFSRAIPPNPKPFTYSGAGQVATGTSTLIEIPYYAQAVDVWANGWVGGIGAATAPVLRCADIGLYRDYTTGLFVPPWGPVSLSGDSLSTDAFDITNAGAADVRAFVQFYLDP